MEKVSSIKMTILDKLYEVINIAKTKSEELSANEKRIAELEAQYKQVKAELEKLREFRDRVKNLVNMS